MRLTYICWLIEFRKEVGESENVWEIPAPKFSLLVCLIYCDVRENADSQFLKFDIVVLHNSPVHNLCEGLRRDEIILTFALARY